MKSKHYLPSFWFAHARGAVLGRTPRLRQPSSLPAMKPGARPVLRGDTYGDLWFLSGQMAFDPEGNFRASDDRGGAAGMAKPALLAEHDQGQLLLLSHGRWCDGEDSPWYR